MSLQTVLFSYRNLVWTVAIWHGSCTPWQFFSGRLARSLASGKKEVGSWHAEDSPQHRSKGSNVDVVLCWTLGVLWFGLSRPLIPPLHVESRERESGRPSMSQLRSRWGLVRSWCSFRSWLVVLFPFCWFSGSRISVTNVCDSEGPFACVWSME